MNADDRAILDWLDGREKLPHRGFPSPGLAALIRRLEAGEPLGETVSVALAIALDAAGNSAKTLKLEYRRRGRPTDATRRAYELHKLGGQIDAELTAEGAKKGRKPKRSGVMEDVAGNAGKSRASGHEALQTVRRVRGQKN